MRNLRYLLSPLLACLLLAGGLAFHAQGSQYSPDQISQMVAPIALYPDALMSQVLMAATFPDQVTQAGQWVQANPGLTGNALDDALATATWDPSIIALCKFPTVLDRMAQNIQWTTDLGNAFLNQQTDVMNAVQSLRSEAYRTGHLRTTEQQRVVVQGPDIVIQPYTTDVVYVPAYEPAVVFGPLWSYPSYYYPGVWAPWPGYSFVNGFAWGLGFAVGNVLFGGCDWGNNSVYVNNTVIVNNDIYHNSPYYLGGYWRGGYDRQPWAHHPDQFARGGIGAPYGGRNYGHVRGISGGPARLTGGGMERAAAQGLRGGAGNVAHRDSRAAVHGPMGYTGDRSNRLASRGPQGYRGSTFNRPAYNRPAYSAPAYNRPAYNRPAYSAPAYNRPAYSGNAGGGWHAPAAHGGGQRGHNRR